MSNKQTVQICEVGAQQPFGRLIRHAAGGERLAVQHTRHDGADNGKTGDDQGNRVKKGVTKR
jgi:hypothetical protein